MSTRLSASTKDMINRTYNLKIKVLEDECTKIKERIAVETKVDIMNSKPFINLMSSALIFEEYMLDKYPDFYLYSTMRDLFRMARDTNESRKDFGYYDKSEMKSILDKDKDYCKLQEEAKILTKEKNSLLFKLENAPIKSKDYEEAYYTLREMLNKEQD